MNDNNDLTPTEHLQKTVGSSDDIFDLTLLERVSIYSTTTSQESSAKGGLRVSLACVPCRNRHVKCGAETPACTRCHQDGKPCFYAKSRRGLRDKSTTVKRASSSKQRDLTDSRGAAQAVPEPVPVAASLSYSAYSSDASDNAQTSSMSNLKSSTPKRLIDLYYSYFHSAHPFLLPKYQFLSRWQTDPESLKHIVPVMQYIGSMYVPDVDSSEARAIAMGNFDPQSMPSNGFTVQALLLAAIAVYADDKLENARVVLDGAINMAIELGMHHRTFATMEVDPVLAESWRRTYWFMYITDSGFAGYLGALFFNMYTVEATVEMPCEESEFEGIIPIPKRLEDYDSRDFEHETPVFSSFTYLLGLNRIAAYIFAIKALPIEQVKDAVSNADAMLVNWRLHLPREKQGVYDKNGDIDEILFRAHYTLQLLMIRIHRPLSQLYQLSLETISTHVHSPRPQANDAGDGDEAYWLHTKKTLTAAGVAISLYALPDQILRHSPLYMRGLLSSISVQISACAWLLKDEEWLRAWNRIRLGLGVLKAFNEIWANDRGNEREMKGVARVVFESCRPGAGDRAIDVGNQVQSVLWQASSLMFVEPLVETGIEESYGMWHSGTADI